MVRLCYYIANTYITDWGKLTLMHKNSRITVNTYIGLIFTMNFIYYVWFSFSVLMFFF